MAGQPENKVTKRNISFTKRPVTKIWQEVPNDENPYLAEKCRCHGYDLEDLIKNCSYVEMLFLIFLGELPTPSQRELLETLMIAFSNPGPRHPATRAAMNAGVGKTDSAHILPIGLSVLSGEHLGGPEVESSIRFLRKNSRNSPEELVGELLENESPEEGDYHIAPGFGTHFGGIDPIPHKAGDILLALEGSGEIIKWGCDFAEALHPYGMGWLSTGVAAAVLCDLGFLPNAGAGLFQLICAPGILAHGLELANKPISAMPFLDEENYVIETEEKR